VRYKERGEGYRDFGKAGNTAVKSVRNGTCIVRAKFKKECAEYDNVRF
jgi:hypothetical protein